MHNLPNNDTFDSPSPGDCIGNKGDSQSRADDFPILDQLRHDTVDGIHGYGKSDSRKGSARTDDLRVDPNQSASTIKQRSAGIAWVNGRIGLNHTFDRSI